TDVPQHSQTIYRKGQPPQRRRRRRKPQSQLPTLLMLGALALVICVVVGLVSCNSGPRAPETPDYGSSAGAWMKNEKGYYFNDAGEAIPGAVSKGIDVAKYQGEVDWEKARAAGVEFAILRCGYGGEWDGQEANWNQDDPQWRRNADECTRLGIPFGVYLYSYATTVEEAQCEADHVARLLGLVAPPQPGLEDYTAAPYKLDYPVYYDLEDKYISGVFPDEMADMVAAFFERLESYGYTGRQGLYASVNWVRARFSDAAYDPWRDELWIARFNSTLGYDGAYHIWQCSYTAPGADYGVESETVDIDFVMKSIGFSGIEKAKGKTAAPTFRRDTYQSELWLGQARDTAALTLYYSPAAAGDDQKVFWFSSDSKVATVSKNGVVKAVGEGQCTVTATLADGTLSATCVVRVGDVTVPVFATGALHGMADNDAVSLADVAALKASYEDSILVDAGGSLHGTAGTSLTGGMDMTSAFSAAGYDLQAVGAADLAFGIQRLRSDVAVAAGPTLASNLRDADGAPLLYRTTSWNRNRISNGMNGLVSRAGKNIGFFSLADPGTVNGVLVTPREQPPTAADALQTASEQVAALTAKGADAVICILSPDFTQDDDAFLRQLAQLGVTAVIDGGRQEAVSAALPVLPAATGLSQVARLDLTFRADGVTATAASVSANALQSARQALSGTAYTAYERTANTLTELALGDSTLSEQVLFTYAPNPKTKKTISFGNYVAQLYADLAAADSARWPAPWAGAEPVALVGYTAEPVQGELTRGDLQSSIPGDAHRILLVETTSAAIARLINGGTVTQTYMDGMRAYDAADGPALLITDTLALQNLEPAEYTILRDYGDVFWNVRMAINDATANFSEAFVLPEAPVYGVGRNS
ncbi:MAG: Ig-like domain-containing protein, partial [Gemmiger sp.]